jgi:hypothetical protein
MPDDQAGATPPNTIGPLSVWWSVVRGPSPAARAVEPGVAAVAIPGDILTWAAGHGLSETDPDVYLLVTPMDEAGRVDGEISGRLGEIPAGAVAAIRAELAAGELF